MTFRKILRVVSWLAAITTLTGSVVMAQPDDRRTYFTFNRPITLPGVTLPAGTYLFRIADPSSSRKVIQVASADGKESYAMLFTMARDRHHISSHSEIRFMETGKGTPSAVQTWWYSGERTGYEFIYPKKQARLLVAGVSEPILTTHVETVNTEEIASADLTLLAASGQEADVVSLPAVTPGVVEEGRIAAVLPRTASRLPLVGLVGLMALLGAAAMRVRTRRGSGAKA